MKIASPQPQRPGSPYLRPQGQGDTYDEFEGVSLPGLGAGSFSDQFSKTETEQVDADPKAARRLERQLERNPKFRKVEIGPTAEQATTSSQQEEFKGVTLFNRWRVGPYERTQTSQQVTTYQVSAEMPIGGGSATTRMKISETIPGPKQNQSGWYFFD